jgi:hypothetical protein
MLENPQKLRLFHKKNVNITILLSCYYHAIIMLLSWYYHGIIMVSLFYFLC